MTVFFYCSDDVALETLRNLNPDEDIGYFNIGERIWTVQTFLRLRKAGYPVELTSRLPRSGTVVVHRDSVPQAEASHGVESITFVSIRADRAAAPHTDVEIVQNQASAETDREIFIPHWPQPGLKPRREARGSRIKVLAYKGYADNLYKPLTEARWRKFIDEHDLRWRFDAVEWNKPDQPSGEIQWHDYRDVDLVIALRTDPSYDYPEKPASKLINAWRAGVPAVLGPERAYREIRESPLDYMEATSLEEVKNAVQRLRREPSVYRQMVRHGRERAEDYSFGAILDRWVDVLFRRVPRLASGCCSQLKRRIPLRIREIGSRARMNASRRVASVSQSTVNSYL